MIIIKCPNCGERNNSEFRYGGEFNSRPAKPMEASNEEWTDYVFFKDNKWGVQKEWWYHRSGCQLWFIVERHTRTNEVESTSMWQPASSNGGD